MTGEELLRGAFVSLETDRAFSEAVLRLRDDSRLCFCHRVGERWAKAVGPEGREAEGGMAADVLSRMALFRLNAKHLDIAFTDGSRWELKEMNRTQTLVALPGHYAVCRLPADAPWPPWATGDFVSISRTADELSVVCSQDAVPSDVRCERDWRCLRVAGTIDFTVVGVVASLTQPLAQEGISVFVVSTFDTDYLLVKDRDFDRACAALRRHGHRL